MELRDYQEKVLDDIRAAYKAGYRAPLLVAPTGSGKSAMLSHILGKTKKRTLILVHRSELLEQITSGLPKGHGIIAPGRSSSDAQIQIGMMQTVSKRLDTLPAFEWIISDEAHLSIAPTWLKIMKHYSSAWQLGLSASPCRLDGKGLGEHFDHIVYGPSIRELTERGFLVPARIFAPPGAISALTDADLDAAAAELDRPSITGSAVEHLQRLAPNRRTLVFCCTRDHAEHVAQEFRAGGFSSAAVDGSMPPAERKRRIEAFRVGEIQVLVNVDLLTTGFDCPQINAGVFLRPTGSLALYLQMVGRLLRPSAGKTDAILLDHVGAVARHGLPDAEREWSLDGSVKKTKPPAIRICPECYCAYSAASRACPACGHAPEAQGAGGREVEQVAGVLEEIAGEHLKRARAVPLRAAMKDAKTEAALRELAAARGYGPGWIKHVLAGRAAREARYAAGLVRMTMESDLQAQIRLALGRDARHCRMFRNNRGVFWAGKVVHRDRDTVTLKRPRQVEAGLVNGASDLIGWSTITVTAGMIGQRNAMFAAAEVKTKTGRVSKDQARFIDNIVAAGGLAAVVRARPRRWHWSRSDGNSLPDRRFIKIWKNLSTNAISNQGSIDSTMKKHSVLT